MRRFNDDLLPELVTSQGKKMAELVQSMEELRTWLEENHPAPAKEDGGQ